MAETAYVLINTRNKELKDILEDVRIAKGVTGAYAITGPYDIVAVMEAENLSLLGQLITTEIHPIPGVERTLSCIVINLDKKTS
ncbi:MAG: Lrp/AsnC ligand binding domain-containing protein [Chloroflexota bacterium]|nr:Lrp/AsnC ligand binding domain-containing protein [Chloroflexota bacterium]